MLLYSMSLSDRSRRITVATQCLRLIPYYSSHPASLRLLFVPLLLLLNLE